MKNEITINIRVFPVQCRDRRTGKEVHISTPVTKEQLRAAQVVGQSSKELIDRLCARQGFNVLDIGKPSKMAVSVDLDALARKELG